MAIGTRAIPRAREILYDLLDELSPEHQAKVEEALALMYRRRPTRRPAPATARQITPEMAEAIRAFHRVHPTMPHRDIGRIFDVDGGRVTECVHHDR